MLERYGQIVGTRAAVRHLRVFIGSPSDVPRERAIVVAACQRLQYEPPFRGRAFIEVVAWDGPYEGVPMLAQVDPQAAVNLGMPRPSECDVAVFILWSRFGTPLASQYLKGDGSPFRSGTEYELADALEGHRTSGVPDVLLYHRSEVPTVSLGGAEESIAEARRQYDLVATFLADNASRGINEYPSVDDFAQIFPGHLRAILARRLEEEWREPKELALAFLDGLDDLQAPAAASYLADPRADQAIRRQLLERFGDDPFGVDAREGVEGLLTGLSLETGVLEMEAITVASKLWKRGLIGSSPLFAAARHREYAVRAHVLERAVIVNLPESVDLVEMIAGTFKYHVPIYKGVDYVTSLSREGVISRERKSAIIDKFLTNPRLSDVVRGRLEAARADASDSPLRW